MTNDKLRMHAQFHMIAIWGKRRKLKIMSALSDLLDIFIGYYYDGK